MVKEIFLSYLVFQIVFKKCERKISKIGINILTCNFRTDGLNDFFDDFFD